MTETGPRLCAWTGRIKVAQTTRATMLPDGTTARTRADQASFLDAALRSGKRISLDVLLPLEWSPGNYRDPRPGDPFYLPTAAQRRADEQLIFRNPCLLVTAAKCEAAKYLAPWPQ